MSTEKITVHTNPRCKNCLGSGIAVSLYGGEHVCNCVTEQLRIISIPKDYSIKDRYTPGQPEYVREDK